MKHGAEIVNVRRFRETTQMYSGNDSSLANSQPESTLADDSDRGLANSQPKSTLAGDSDRPALRFYRIESASSQPESTLALYSLIVNTVPC